MSHWRDLDIAIFLAILIIGMYASRQLSAAFARTVVAASLPASSTESATSPSCSIKTGTTGNEAITPQATDPSQTHAVDS